MLRKITDGDVGMTSTLGSNTNNQTLSMELKCVRLRCLGHLVKNADRYMMKMLFVSNPCDKRMQQRPWKRQLDDVENDPR